MTWDELDEIEAHAQGRLLTREEATEYLLEVIKLLREAIEEQDKI